MAKAAEELKKKGKKIVNTEELNMIDDKKDEEILF